MLLRHCPERGLAAGARSAGLLVGGKGTVETMAARAHAHEPGAALNAGRKIEAIRIVRKRQGIDLKAAQELVDGYVAVHPEIRAELERRRALGKRKWFLWLVFPGLLALFAVQYLSPT
ncbi:MAG TPA: hypothetical protein VLM41_04025 [Steroidobacteraceae bacterium]|nr:hypothetical protein [Steroidobacteraceae bacterium]